MNTHTPQQCVISPSYVGNRSYGVMQLSINNALIYKFFSAGSPAEISEHVQEFMHDKHFTGKAFVYYGVNENGCAILTDAIKQLNEQKEISLDTLLI
jgi:hypothetical protein